MALHRNAKQFVLANQSSVLWGIALVGALVRLRAFFSGRSLWLDEAMLADAIAQLQYSDLLSQGLANNQIAPIGLIIGTKALIDLFGLNLLTARAIPLVFGLALLPVVVLLSQVALKSKVAQVFLVGAVSLSPILVYYSSELKHYSADAFVVSLALLMISKSSREGAKTTSIVTLFFLNFFSIAALPVTLLAVFYALESRWSFRKNHASSPWRFGTSALPLGWIFTALPSAFFLATVSSRDSMVSYWRRSNGFPPDRFSSPEEILWFPIQFLNLLSDPFVPQQISAPRPYAESPLFWLPILALIGWGLVKIGANTSQSFALFVLFMPVVSSHLLIYPIGGRLSLFTSVAVVLLIGFGLDELIQKKFTVARTLLAAVAILVLVFPGARISAVFFAFPQNDRDAIWALQQVNHWSSDKAVLLVTHENFPQVVVHQQMVSSPPMEVLVTDGELTADQLTGLKGKEVWVLATHALTDSLELLKSLGEGRVHDSCFFNGSETLVALVMTPDNYSKQCRLEKPSPGR